MPTCGFWAYALWKSDRWQPLLRAELLPETITDRRSYAEWLPGLSLDNRFINLVHLVLWAYQMMGRRDYMANESTANYLPGKSSLDLYR